METVCRWWGRSSSRRRESRGKKGILEHLLYASQEPSYQPCSAGVFMRQVQMRKLRLREGTNTERLDSNPVPLAHLALSSLPSPGPLEVVLGRELRSQPDRAWPSNPIPQHPPGGWVSPHYRCFKKCGPTGARYCPHKSGGSEYRTPLNKQLMGAKFQDHY